MNTAAINMVEKVPLRSSSKHQFAVYDASAAVGTFSC
ncbi:hypothetical protein LEMLEM_LOCUS16775 [Lemmus lemmus]